MILNDSLIQLTHPLKEVQISPKIADHSNFFRWTKVLIISI